MVVLVGYHVPDDVLAEFDKRQAEHVVEATRKWEKRLIDLGLFYGMNQK
jgi:hypothetical protein